MYLGHWRNNNEKQDKTKQKNIHQKQLNNMSLRKEISMKNKYIDTFPTVLYSERTIIFIRGKTICDLCINCYV